MMRPSKPAVLVKVLRALGLSAPTSTGEDGPTGCACLLMMGLMVAPFILPFVVIWLWGMR
jgi:hypothetical protein